MSEKHDVQHQSMNDLVQAESMAYFRADLAESMPESYSLEEKRRICDEMIQSTAAILDAMRADFQARSPEEPRGAARAPGRPLLGSRRGPAVVVGRPGRRGRSALPEGRQAVRTCAAGGEGSGQ